MARTRSAARCCARKGLCLWARAAGAASAADLVVAVAFAAAVAGLAIN